MSKRDLQHLNIAVQPSIKKEQLAAQFSAGTPPFLRGNHSCTLLAEKLNPKEGDQIISISSGKITDVIQEGIRCIETERKKGQHIDEIVTRLYFNWSLGDEIFVEVAKIRALRYVWASLLKSYHPRNQNSMRLPIFTDKTTKQTQQFICLFAGIETRDPKSKLSLLQWLKENSLDKCMDPLGGIDYLETLTDSFVNHALYFDYNRL